MSPRPNRHLVSLIPDPEFDAVTDRIREAHRMQVSDWEMLRAVTAGPNGSASDEPFREGWLCPDCGRLYLLDPNGGHVITRWAPESGDSRPFQSVRAGDELRSVWRSGLGDPEP